MWDRERKTLPGSRSLLFRFSLLLLFCFFFFFFFSESSQFFFRSIVTSWIQIGMHGWAVVAFDSSISDEGNIVYQLWACHHKMLWIRISYESTCTSTRMHADRYRCRYVLSLNMVNLTHDSTRTLYAITIYQTLFSFLTANRSQFGSICVFIVFIFRLIRGMNLAVMIGWFRVAFQYDPVGSKIVMFSILSDGMKISIF